MAEGVAMTGNGPAIDALQHEGVTYPPPPGMCTYAVIGSPAVYARADADPIGWWEEQAHRLQWDSPWDVALDDSTPPFYRWFTGGTLNASANCLDRHLHERGDRVAFHWEGEPGDRLSITYRELHGRVCRFANALKDLGVERGGRVAIYMGMILELPIAMLACARLGAAHTVVFGGFSSEALRDRMEDFGATVLVTQDHSFRAGKKVPLKANSDAALAQAPGVRHCVVARRSGDPVDWTEDRDLWFQDIEDAADPDCPAEPM
ncbi:MAG: AMP-binding protein, partial [Miltoncostaeaceae bacterium]